MENEQMKPIVTTQVVKLNYNQVAIRVPIADPYHETIYNLADEQTKLDMLIKLVEQDQAKVDDQQALVDQLTAPTSDENADVPDKGADEILPAEETDKLSV